MKQGDYPLGYRGDIEGLRALAILLVIGAHAGVPWLAGGFVGVDVFFVLSGFLITGLLLREVSTTGTVAFGKFYLRRLRRLMPALVLMVVVTALVAGVVLAPEEQLQQSGAAGAATLWISNIYFALGRMDYFAPGAETNLYLHTWSLGVEEQFYLVWPLLILAFGKGLFAGRAKGLLLVLVVIVVSGFVGSWVFTPKFPQWAFYMMPSRAWEFGLGALVGLCTLRGYGTHLVARQGGGRIRVAGWLGLLMVVVPAAIYDGAMSYPGWRAAVPVVGAALVLYVGSFRADVGASHLLSCRPAQWFGQISYAWYLWHWPALLLACAMANSHESWVRATAVMASLLIAIASYRWVEYPLRHQAWWLSRRRVTVLGSVLIVTLVNALSMQWSQSASSHMADPSALRYESARLDIPGIYAEGCDDYFRSSVVRPCSFGLSTAHSTVVLIGDSIAGQWFPAVKRIAAERNWHLVVLTKSACPMVDEIVFLGRIRREYTECATWRRDALAYVAALRPEMVVLSTSAAGGFSKNQWAQGTSRVLRSISSSTKRIFILRGTPVLPFDGPSCLESRAENPVKSRRVPSCEAALSDVQNEMVMLALQEASAGFVNAHVVDMDDLVCPHGVCEAERRGMVVFRDSQHMTASFAESLAAGLALRLDMPKTGTTESEAVAQPR